MTGFESKREAAAGKLQEPAQEPVACVHIKDGCLVGSHRDESKPFPDGQYGLWPIHTTPTLPVQPAAKAQDAKDAANEAAAKALYKTWHSLPGYVPWQDGGNSLMQDEARKLVRLAAHNIGEMK